MSENPKSSQSITMTFGAPAGAVGLGGHHASEAAIVVATVP